MTPDSNGRGLAVKLPGVHKVKRKLANGSVRLHYYAWRGGPKLDPQDLIGSYQRAHEKKNKPHQSTLSGVLLRQWSSSSEFRGRSAKWLREKQRFAQILVEEFGEDDITVFDDRRILRDIHALKSSYRDTPAKANHLLSQLTAFLNWSIKRGYISKNLAQGVERFKLKSHANVIWTPEEIASVCEKASQEVEWVIRFAALTGLDRSDIVKLNWSDIREDRTIRLNRGKTDQLIVIPIYEPLKDLIAELPRFGPKVFTNSKKRPWSNDGVSVMFHKAKKAAGTDKRFKDLRGTAATFFYGQGLEDREVADIMGWSENTCRQIRKAYVTNDARADGIVKRLNKSV